LPTAAPPRDESEPALHEHSNATTVNSVLIVDDDESVRLILSEQLRDFGLEVSVAESGERALAMLGNGSGKTQFVLTDFSMPGLDGVTLLEAVRNRWPQIRGAIMTGNPQESLRRCDPDIPVIHKPIDPNELKRILTVDSTSASH